MKIFLLTLTFFLTITLGLSSADAAPVNQGKAQQAAFTFLKQKNKSKEFSIVSIMPYIDNEIVSLYMVSLSPEGFIILSADDNAQPILGYSFENSLPESGMNSGFSEWMLGYSKYVRVCSENQEFQLQQYQQQWINLQNGIIQSDAPADVVGPLLTCTWNQSFPYNSECPEASGGSGGHVYAGCVATAMSQVMYYYRFPQTGTGSYGYTHYVYGYLFADFGATEYKWNEMPNAAGSNYFELAQLQSHLGISVDMDYSPDGSGAYSQDAAESLKTYFGYSDDLNLLYKDNFSDENWKQIVKENIDNKHPLYYHGFGSGGHAFNLDGYDGDYFHFNWGWGGSANGYFSLNNLNPSGMNFSYGQGAIVNFYPGVGYPYYCSSVQTITSHTGSIEDGSGPLNEYLPNSDCGWLISVNDSLSSLKLTFDRFDIEEGKDSLLVFAGSGADAPLLGAFTGSTLPPVISTTGSQLYVNFKTDGQNNSGGWLATFKATPVMYCNGVDTYTDSVASINDGSGTFDYHDNTSCIFKIIPPNARTITLDFNSFSTFNENDYLKITDINTGEELYRFYGNSNPGRITVNSGKILILFRTDGQHVSTGWNFTYHANYVTSNRNTELNDQWVSLYPQPATDKVTIKAYSGKSIDAYSIYSMDGKLMFICPNPDNTSGDKVEINIADFPDGLYLLAVETDHVRVMKKMVIAR